MRWDVLGEGSWEGARVVGDGREVLVVFTGAAEYDPQDPCTVEYRVEAEETPSEVRVRIGTPVGPEIPEGWACDLVGYRRHVRISLAEPIGERVLVEAQFDREQPVLRSALAEVGGVPEGWAASPEGPAPQGLPMPPMTNEAKERFVNSGESGLYEGIHWQRAWAPPRPAAQNGSCTPTEAGMALIEGPPDFARRSPNGEEHDVNGVRATYTVERHGDEASTGRMTWVAGESGFAVETRTGCLGDTLTPIETLLRFARALTRPAGGDRSDTPEAGSPSGPGSSSAVAAAFTNPPPYPGVSWTKDGSPVPTMELMASAGPEHCGWESATMLWVGWPLGTEAQTSEQARQYVRDPGAVLPPDGLRGTLDLAATLPADAQATGYRTGGVELYISPTDSESVVYLVGPDGSERWPRNDPMVTCA